MPLISKLHYSLAQNQRFLADFPWTDVKKDYDRIYKKGQREIGRSKIIKRATNSFIRKNTVAVIGAMYGDEGKGRFVDDKIRTLLTSPQIKRVNVIRFQGGNNAGHTIELENGKRLALHVIPSGVLYKKARGIIDRGTIVHVEDLQTEFEYVSLLAGDVTKRVILSEEAMLCTDLERAEEQLNKKRTEGKSEGGTGRGIGPTAAHHLDRRGLKITDLLMTDWKKVFAARYDDFQKEFAAYDIDLETALVPDFRQVKLYGITTPKAVGTKKIFLKRLADARKWLLSSLSVQDTIPLHRDICYDSSQGVLFEGAQGIGLHPWLGSYPDVTSTDTSVQGILSGTGFWKPEYLSEKIGILKGPYTSSVGKRQLPTMIPLSREENILPPHATANQERGVFIREKARERGTTTGRWRDIAQLDLANLAYNATVGGIDSLAITMMDVVRESDTIRVCTHYKKQGKFVAFRPGLKYMKELTPVYIELPGWNGEACSHATMATQLPEHALNYLSFIQARTGFPVIATTVSPTREKLITFPGYLSANG